MKVESRIFEICTVFFFLCAIVYGILSKEAVGIVALTLTGGLSLIIGTYFRFVARRIDLRPEDYEEAEIVDGAGDLGFFSPGSFWPILLAGAGSVTALGLAFFQFWLIGLGVVLVLAAAAGLVFEYYLGAEKH